MHRGVRVGIYQNSSAGPGCQGQAGCPHAFWGSPGRQSWPPAKPVVWRSPIKAWNRQRPHTLHCGLMRQSPRMLPKAALAPFAPGFPQHLPRLLVKALTEKALTVLGIASSSPEPLPQAGFIAQKRRALENAMFPGAPVWLLR